MSQSNTREFINIQFKKNKQRNYMDTISFSWLDYGSLGSMVKQIFYYLTLGGLGLWTLYRLFTLMTLEQSKSITEK